MKKENNGAAIGKILIAMVIYGTIGLFVRKIPLPSSVIAMARGIIGTLFLLGWMALRREKPDWGKLRKNGWLLIFSGAAMAANWILLFEAYRYTTVAVATLCYYLMPVFLIIGSAVFFREKITLRKGLCLIAGIAGMVLVTVNPTQTAGTESAFGNIGWKGIALGLGAAVLYAGVVLMNKRMDVPACDRTVGQLAMTVAALLPYNLLTGAFTGAEMNAEAWIFLLILGVVHTGIAYSLYFSALTKLSGQTAALLSYIDPVTALLLSALILGEPLSPLGIVGAILILGSAAIGA